MSPVRARSAASLSVIIVGARAKLAQPHGRVDARVDEPLARQLIVEHRVLAHAQRHVEEHRAPADDDERHQQRVEPHAAVPPAPAAQAGMRPRFASRILHFHSVVAITHERIE